MKKLFVFILIIYTSFGSYATGIEDEVIHNAPDAENTGSSIEIINSVKDLAYFNFTKDQLIKQFGEPDMIFSEDGIFMPDNLPSEYNFLYTGRGLSFFISDGKIEEITILSPDYKFENGIGIGSTESEIINTFNSSYQRLDLGSKIYLVFNQLGLTFKISKADNLVWEILLKKEPEDDFGIMLNERISRLNLKTSSLRDIIDIFGEPEQYIWGNRTFSKNDLPEYYFMVYTDDFKILMNNYNIVEISIQSEKYMYKGILRVGSNLEDVLRVMGEPDQIISGQNRYFENGILYKNIDNEADTFYYERKESGLRVFLKEGLVNTIYLIPSE